MTPPWLPQCSSGTSNFLRRDRKKAVLLPKLADIGGDNLTA